MLKYRMNKEQKEQYKQQKEEKKLQDTILHHKSLQKMKDENDEKREKSKEITKLKQAEKRRIEKEYKKNPESLNCAKYTWDTVLKSYYLNNGKIYVDTREVYNYSSKDYKLLLKNQKQKKLLLKNQK